MKKILLKTLSLFLCAILLMGAMYTLPTVAATEGNATLTPVKMTYSHSHSTISGSNNGIFRTLWNNYCAAYAIVLESDTSFNEADYDTTFVTTTNRASTAYLSSYENLGKLDYAYVYNKDGSATHDALANMIRDNIYINGMSLGDAIEDNAYNKNYSVLVGITGNKISIVIPVAYSDTNDGKTNANQNFNNSEYGLYVGDFGSTPAAVDYTISIGDGIKIGDTAINPMSYRLNATNESHSKTGTFTKIADTQNNATLTPTKMQYTHGLSKTNQNSNKGIFRTIQQNYSTVYVVTLESDTAFDSSVYNSVTEGRNIVTHASNSPYKEFDYLDYANIYSSDTLANHNAIATMLRENIYINGMSIADAMVSNTSYTTVSILVGIAENKITIFIPVGVYKDGVVNTNLEKTFNNAEHGFYVGDYGSNEGKNPAAVDFTISIGDGIKIGDVAINPMTYRFNALDDQTDAHENTGTFDEITINVMGASVDTAANGDIRFEVNADFATYNTYGDGIEEVGVMMIPTAFVTNGEDKVVALDSKYYYNGKTYMKHSIKKFTIDEVLNAEKDTVTGMDKIYAILENSSAASSTDDKYVRIRTDISARAYIKFKDGTIVYSHNNIPSLGIIDGTSSRSCIDVIRAIARKNNVTGVEETTAKSYKSWTSDDYNSVIGAINTKLGYN